jgi:(p)ppGpp synthase/HD superfamily hydrolase
MTQADFQDFIDQHSCTLEEIKATAHALHASVNQTYGKKHPYGLHLDMVVDSVCHYGHLVCADEQDVLPLFFGAYFHDSIEDTRQTYNDVTKIACRWMDKEQAHTAAEIVYALTNDKGRTRAERAGENYYRGIRETPYAPFVKLADRLANITFSCTNESETNTRMIKVYKQELPHFLEAIDAHSEDGRMALPQVMVNQIYAQIS